MSHFTVLVIGNDPEELLAPYQENNMGDCPEEYLEFNDYELQYREDYISGKASEPGWHYNGLNLLPTEDFEELKNTGGIIRSGFKPDYNFRDGYKPGDRIKIQKYNVEEDCTEENDDLFAEVKDFDKKFGAYDFYLKLIDPPPRIPLNTKYKTFELYLEDWHGAEIDEKTGKYGHWENPNKKWDWYQLGGRWAGFFKLKKIAQKNYGGKSHVDQAKKGDIDFAGMIKDKVKNAKKAWKESEKVTDPAMRYFNYGREMQHTEEVYIAQNSELNTHAFILDGKWYQQGEMGWFAQVKKEKEEIKWISALNETLNSLPEDALISLYDCHI